MLVARRLRELSAGTGILLAYFPFFGSYLTIFRGNGSREGGCGTGVER